MREIKFRAWDLESKKMYLQMMGDREAILKNMGEKAFFKLGEVIIEDNPILMQFTGLKDKNGKEIYEGDVIICRDGKYVIEYIESFAKFVMTNKDIIRTPEQLSSQDADTCMRSIEVIGNKFENPELLK